MTISLKTVDRLNKLAHDQNALAARFVECDPKFYRFAKSCLTIRNLFVAMATELETELKAKR